MTFWKSEMQKMNFSRNFAEFFLKFLRSICSPTYANNCVSRNNVPVLTPGASWTHLVRCPGRLVRPPSVTRGLGSSHWWCSGMAGGSQSTSLAPGTGSAPSSPLRYNAYAMQPVAGQPTASAHVVSERASKMYWVRMKRKI